MRVCLLLASRCAAERLSPAIKGVQISALQPPGAQSLRLNFHAVKRLQVRESALLAREAGEQSDSEIGVVDAFVEEGRV